MSGFAVKGVRRHGPEIGVRKVGARAGRDAARSSSLVIAGGKAPRADPTLIQNRHVYNAQQRASALGEGDQGPEHGAAGDEALRSIDRVEHPKQLRIGLQRRVLLPQDAVLRIGVLDEPAQGRLGFAVGNGDRRQVGLLVDCELRAKVLEHRQAGPVRELFGEGDELKRAGRNRHAHMPAGRRPRSARPLLGRSPGGSIDLFLGRQGGR